MPEVRRIVSSSAFPLPENKYVEGCEVVLSGVVNYTVLYIGEDGKLNAVHLSSEYSVNIKCGNTDMTGLSRDSIVSNTSVTSNSCRATGPRKLSLGCRLYSKLFSASAYACRETVNVSSGGKSHTASTADEITLERKKNEVTSTSVISAKQTGDVSGEVKNRPGTKIIACEAGTGITDVKIGHRDVTVKGEAYIDFITEDTSGDVANIPNTLSKFTTAVAEEHINISDMLNRSRGEYAYTMLDLDHPASEALVQHLSQLDGVLRVRRIR